MSAPKNIRVTAEDLETGEVQVVEIEPGDFNIVCAKPLYLDGVQSYPGKGTYVLTLKTARGDG